MIYWSMFMLECDNRDVPLQTDMNFVKDGKDFIQNQIYRHT